MKTHTVLMDFVEVFGEPPCEQVRGGDALLPEANNAQQVANSAERTCAIGEKIRAIPTVEHVYEERPDKKNKDAICRSD